MAQLRADIANKEADTAYKQGLMPHEPWKVLAAGLAAGAGLMAAATALVSILYRAAAGH